jgi:hypothetical protein
MALGIVAGHHRVAYPCCRILSLDGHVGMPSGDIFAKMTVRASMALPENGCPLTAVCGMLLE